MQAKNAGHKAYYAKVDVNPHPVGTVNHAYWRKAWLAAQAEFNKRLARKKHPMRCTRQIQNVSPTGRFLGQSEPKLQNVPSGGATLDGPCDKCKTPTVYAPVGGANLCYDCALTGQNVPPALKGAVQRFEELSADPELQDINKTFAGENPSKKFLTSTSGSITALKSVRETPKAWMVVYYGGEGEKRISKDDPRRRVVETMVEAEAWASGEAQQEYKQMRRDDQQSYEGRG